MKYALCSGGAAAAAAAAAAMATLKIFVSIPCSPPSRACSTIARAAAASSSSSPACPSISSPPTPPSVYIHLPFCSRRCFYCDFPIIALGQRTPFTSPYVHDSFSQYVDILCREIAATLCPPRSVSPLQTIFFGGGTPSLLPPSQLQRIIDCLHGSCDVAPEAEVSLEMDPGTFDLASLRGFLGCGVTRVSLGVQAFQEDLLRACGRAHGLQEVHEAIAAIQTSGLKNWSLDLIASLPHQTTELWMESLRKAVEAGPAHISVYDLQVEEGTMFGRWYQPGQAPLPTDEKSAEFYRLASRMLREAGYEHYEISNYAKPGYQCKHNMVYWHNLPYLAFGLGSTSYTQGRRFSRPRKLKEYYKFVEDLEARSGKLVCEEESFEERVCDVVMLSLRLARGLDIVDFSEEFGTHLACRVFRALVPFVESGHAIALDAQNQPVPTETFVHFCKEIANNLHLAAGAVTSPSPSRVAFVRLSDPEGFLFSNEIISSLFTSLPNENKIVN